jgi:ATP-binding cassette subfamily B protein
VTKVLLDAYGIPANLMRLREALQTQVEVTTLAAVERTATRLGLQVEQKLAPAEHVLLQEGHYLPAVVEAQPADGLSHFLVAWDYMGGRVQIMDPARGRRWPAAERLAPELRLVTQTMSATAWRTWASSPEFLTPLRARLAHLGLPRAEVDRLVETALADPDWQALAALDAAARLVAPLARSGDLAPGRPVAHTIGRLFDEARRQPAGSYAGLPAPYWSALPAPSDQNGSEPQVQVRGVRLLQVHGRQAASSAATPPGGAGRPGHAPAPPFLAEREALRSMRNDGLFTPLLLAVALISSSLLVATQAVLLQALLAIGLDLVGGQRTAALGMILLFFLLLALIEYPINMLLRRAGRQLEARLRTNYLIKIPLLSERYFRRLQVSDLTQRTTGLRGASRFPILGVDILRTGLMMVLTTAGVIWLEPASALVAILSLAAFYYLSQVTQPLMQEQEMRTTLLNADMMRFFLDSMIGLVPLHTHGGEHAVRLEHEARLTEWVHTMTTKGVMEMAIKSLARLLYVVFAVAVVAIYVRRGGQISAILLLLYWTQNIPRLADDFTNKLLRYPFVRTQVARSLEPLGEPQDRDVSAMDDAPPTPAADPVTPRPEAAHIELRQVNVQIGKQPILADINLTIAPGEHLALVGPSGAGKSTLVGLFFGWHLPTSGVVLVDGLPLIGQRFYTFRREIAWVDPSIHIWNQSLLDNLYYGLEDQEGTPVVPVIEQADLFAVLEQLPDGMQSVLGEGGGLISGGEGQRVRLARAMLRPDTRLVILDEPFRGLDRERRHALLQRARQFWQRATLICITHDVGETQGFDRVLVLEKGRIVEDAAPTELAARPVSRYRDLLQAENDLRQGLWAGVNWRRLTIQDGHLRDAEASDG